MGYKDNYMTYERSSSLESSFPVLMRKVFTWMAFALVITGMTAYLVAGSPELLYTIMSNKVCFWGLMIAEFGLVISLSAAINKLSVSTATVLFIVYSVINGVMLSSIFVLYTAESIASTFFITAGMFGATALFGYITKKDLSSVGRLMFMALIGLIIATLVNMFLNNSMIQLICSCAGVLIFTGLTAYDTQKIKAILMDADQYDESSQKYAVLGALTLYLDFVNMFLYMLRFLGNRK